MEKQNPPPYSPQQGPGLYPPPPGPTVYPNINPPPPQHHMHPQPQVVVHTSVGFGPQPTHLTCPSCHATITTSVKSEATSKTHLFALLLCLFGLWPCVCIPYCVDSCQDIQHYCPNCQAYLGSYSN